MAFCVKCGGQLVDGAQFCTACGSPVASVPPAVPAQAPAVTTPAQPFAAAAAVPAPPAYVPPAQVAVPKKRSPLVWIIPIIILAVIALGAGGWLAFGLISGGSESGRARAQAEAVADLYEGYTSGDIALIKRVLPGDLHDVLDTEGLGGDDTVRVSRAWDGDVLRLSSSSEENDWENVLEFVADGAKDRGTVTMTVASEDAEGMDPTELVVERQGGRWIVVEMDGEYIGDVIGTTDDGSADEDSGAETDYDSSENEAEACWNNQRMVETVASEYYAAAAENYYSDIEGDLDEYNVLWTDGWLEELPTCPYDGSYYYLFDDGTTGCPSGMHGYYADEE